MTKKNTKKVPKNKPWKQGPEAVVTVPQTVQQQSHCQFRCGIATMVFCVFLLLLIPFGYYAYQVLTLYYTQDSYEVLIDYVPGEEDTESMWLRVTGE